jgi:molecular chaperone DnaJ
MDIRGICVIRNYFSDLELSTDATADEIRQAYKRLARRFHPDLNPMDIHAEESFKRIQKAFDYLDSTERAEALRSRLQKDKISLSPQKWKISQHLPKSPDSFLRDWIEEPSITRTKTHRKENLDRSQTVEIRAEDLTKNFEKRILVEYERPCAACSSRGSKTRKILETCKQCSGIGYHLISRGALQWKKSCEFCRSKGLVSRTACNQCQGNRMVKERELVMLHVAKGVDPSRPLLVNGLGNISFDGKRRGKLWVHLVVSR